jgi:hypothetical protein
MIENDCCVEFYTKPGTGRSLRLWLGLSSGVTHRSHDRNNTNTATAPTKIIIPQRHKKKKKTKEPSYC